VRDTGQSQVPTERRPTNDPHQGQNDPQANWQAAGENSSLVEQFFAGETLLAQLKTVLACVGALAFVFHGGRMLVRTTIASAKSTGKRKRR
jgi:hypothetical protein